jgi:hypothetical protein
MPRPALPTPRPWSQLASTLRRRSNLAWILEASRLPLLAASLASAALTLLLRRAGVAPRPLAFLLGISLAAALALGVWRASRHWLSPSATLARLDALLQMHCRLSAAAEGAHPWPPFPASASRAILPRWNLPRALSAPLFALTLCTGSLLVTGDPVRPPIQRALPSQLPPSLTEAEALLALLAKNETLAPNALQPLRDQLEQLKQRPVSDWYSHGSLESAAQLRDSVENTGRQLGESLLKLEDALQTAPELTQKNHPALQSALEEMRGLQPGLNPELLNQFQQLAQNGRTALPSPQLQDLQRQLREDLQRLRSSGMCNTPLRSTLGNSPGDCTSQESNGDASGGGGKGGGGGSSDLQFSKNRTDLQSAIPEALSSQDLTRALPGDTVRQHRAAPIPAADLSVPDAPQAPPPSNAGASPAWRTRPLPPQETQRLKQFFQNAPR